MTKLSILKSMTTTATLCTTKTPEAKKHLLSFKLKTSKSTTTSSRDDRRKKPSEQIVKQQASCCMFLATFSALLGAIGFGLGIGWSASAFESMSHNTSTPNFVEPKDTELLSWIGSALTLSALFGALFSGIIVQKYGRRLALISYGIPFTFGWILIICAQNGVALLIGRVILGLSIGALSGTTPAYVIDIATIKTRGTLGAFFQLFVVTGILISYIIGAFFYWRITSIISMIPTLLLSLLMYFMPEGPSWLIMNKRYEEAKQALRRIRGSNSDLNREFEELLRESESLSKQTWESQWRLYLQQRHLIPLTLSLGLMIFQQFSGVNAIMFYSTAILSKAGSIIIPSTGTIIIGSAQWLATLVGTGLVDYIGRRTLLIASGILHVISMTVFGLYYTFSREIFCWIPVTSLVIFIIGFSIGWGPVPWLMMAEITPHESKSSTSALSTCCNWFSAFIVTKTFKQLQNLLTKSGVFYLFSVFSFLSILFTIFLLPETKNKSYEEIRKIFEPQLAQKSIEKEILSKEISSKETQTSSSDSA